MEARLYNPDGLPVVDVVDTDAKLILVGVRIDPQTLAGQIFAALWRQCEGRPGSVTTDWRTLLDAHPGASLSGLRKAVRRLESVGLLALPVGRIAGDFDVGVRRVAAAPPDAQQTLFERAPPRDSASLKLVQEAPPPQNALEVYTVGAKSTPKVYTASAFVKSSKISPPEHLTPKEVQAIIERKRAAAPEQTARKSLECSNIPNIPSSHNSSDIPNIPECSGNVEKDVKAGNVPAARTTDAEQFEWHVERIERKLGVNEDYPWMVYSIALLAIDGPLSLATIEAALESAPSWPRFTGAMKKQLATCDKAALVDRGLWDAEKGRARFPHRWPDLRKCARRRGIVLDENRFPPKKPKPR